jgi:hypothetical protein
MGSSNFKTVFAILLFTATTVCCLYQPSYAQDCDPLKPQAAVNSEISNEIKANADTRFKLASGEFDDQYRKVEQDVLSKYPNADTLYIWKSLIYLDCTLLKTSHFSDAEKQKQFDLLMDKATQKPPPPTPKATSSTTKYYHNPLTLRDLYDSDFADRYYTLATSFDSRSVDRTHIYPIAVKLLVDLAAGASFLEVFVPFNINSEIPYDLCMLVAKHHQGILSDLNHRASIGTRLPGDTSTSWSRNTVFSGHVFVYYEQGFSPEQLAALDEFYKQNELAPQFRGQDYLTLHWNEKRAMPNPALTMIIKPASD